LSLAEGLAYRVAMSDWRCGARASNGA